VTHSVRLTPRALGQLDALYARIAEDSGVARAEAYVGSLMRFCQSLALFPQRGRRRDDILAGLRVIGWRRRAAIAVLVEDDALTILGVFHGGQPVSFEDQG
jgi:toxin ParE1/3/4